jgi:uncharacterized membrane protein
MAGAAFIAIGMLRWANYQANAFDLGFFDQIIWNTAHGAWFQNTFVPYNFLGQHLEPVLLIFVPAYWLGAGPPFLLVTQAVVASAATIPLYLAARRFGLEPITACAAAAGYLLNPYLHRAIAFDFHPEVMVALPASAAVWAIAAGRHRTAVALALSALLFKEDAIFVAFALAGLMWLRGLRREASLVGVISLAWAALGILVIMPLARHGAPSDLVERYGYLASGKEGFGLLRALTARPWLPLAEFLHPSNLLTMALFVACGAPTALWRPWLLLGVVPGLALATVSAHPQQRALELHYAVELVPLTVVAGMLSATALRRRLPSGGLGVLLVFPAVAGAVAFHPLVSAVGDAPDAEHRAALEAAISLIPGDPAVSVSGQSSILPRLTHRAHAHEFPSNFDRATYIIVDRYGARSSQSIADGFDWKLAVARSKTDLIFEKDGVQVYRRNP